MTDGLKDAHRKAIIAVIAANDRVERAVLFGSRATGTNTVSSDVDIALFGNELTLTDQAHLAAVLDEIPMAQSVDLLLCDSIESRTLREHIRRQGVEWYVRPPRDERCDAASVSPGPLERLPPGWERLTLGAVCTRAGGSIQTGPFGSQLHASDYRPVGIPSIMPQNLGDNRVIEDGIARIGERDASRLARYLVRAGDIVYSRRGDVERRALIGPREDGWLCGTGCLRVRLGENGIDPRYASYYLGHPVVREWIVRHAHGATMPNLNTAILSACPFLVPPVAEQHAIAHILGTLDDKIELNRRMNATLESMARALFRSWFVDFDPVRAKMAGRDTGLPKEIADLFPDRLVDSELGETPAGWTIGHVEDGFEIVMGQSPPGHTYNDTGDGLPFFQGRSDFGFRYPKNRKFCTAPNRLAHPWDTIVSVRAPVGDINMACERCCIGRGIAVLRSRHGAVSYGYYATQALQTHMHEYEHTGTVFGAINRKQLARLPLTQPAPDIVRAFEDLVHPWDQMIRLRTAEVATLTALRDTVLPPLVSGTLRTANAEPPSFKQGDGLMNAGQTKQDELVKFFCILEELESSRDLIKSGFGHLQEIDMGNTFYHLPHQLMASGLERFMKCYVLLMYNGRRGSYPNNDYVKRLGHDLQKLLKLICADFYGGADRAWVQRELHFVTTDSVLCDCIRILSLFGKKARYYNLDVVSGVHDPPIDPKEEWTALESRVEDVAPFLEDQEALHREYYPRVHSRLIARIERLVRALAMQFTLGGHEDRNGTISRLSGVYTEFRNIRDEELGTTDYRRSVHILRDRDRKNWIERSDREIEEGGYPTRVVTREEFEGDWPFRADRVVVERRDKIFYIVNIEGFAFSLNGAASSRFNVPDPHDAGVAVLGKSVSPFIDMASALT